MSSNLHNLKFRNEKQLYMNMSSKNLKSEKKECFWHIKFNENLQIKRNLKLFCVIITVFIVVSLFSKTKITYESHIYSCVVCAIQGWIFQVHTPFFVQIQTHTNTH